MKRETNLNATLFSISFLIEGDSFSWSVLSSVITSSAGLRTFQLTGNSERESQIKHSQRNGQTILTEDPGNNKRCSTGFTWPDRKFVKSTSASSMILIIIRFYV